MSQTTGALPTSENSFGKAFPHVVIRASAGSGKTFQLTNRYLALLNAGVAPDQILATTFTRKAAGEILNRILFRLAQAATDQSAREQLAENIKDKSLSREKCLALLRQTTSSLHRLRVGTLDSFFSRMAGSYSTELGLPTDWKITDEQTDAALRDEAIQAVLNQDSIQDLLTLMHLLTKGEATRGINDLVRETVRQLYFLYRETKLEAWKKIPHSKPLRQDELEALLEELRTVELPSDKRFATAREKDYQKALADDWAEFVQKGLASKILDGNDIYYKKEIPAQVIAVYKKLLEHAKAVLVGLLAQQTEATYRLLDKFDVEYQRLKNERRNLRFDDITHSLANSPLLQNIQETSFRLDGNISHILLDEFQDTSLVQWQVLRPLSRRVANDGGNTSFFCVGDVKQAIYGWRGGIAEIFAALDHELKNLNQRKLTASYRSAPPIIDTLNRVFRQAADHPNLEHYHQPLLQWCKQFNPHSTERNDLQGYVSLETAPQPTEGRKEQDAVLLYTVDRVAELVEQAPNKTIGILVRRNTTVGKLIYLLRHRQIPASEEGGNPLTDSAAVEVILSLLRLTDHPGDRVARFHLASSPLATLLGITDHDDAIAAEKISRKIRRDLQEAGYGPTIYHWAQQLAASCNQSDLNRLQQLVEIAYHYQSQATLRCDDFIAMIENERVSDPTSANVRVMTLHQAKGLEFDIVVLPELDVKLVGQRNWFVSGRPEPTQPIELVCRDTNEHIRKMLPASIQKLFTDDTNRLMSEALCVLYVALTRPIHALHMIIAPSKPKEGKLSKTFAGLLRAALTDKKPLAGRQTVYQSGNKNWFEQGETKDTVSKASSSQPAQVERHEIRFAPAEGSSNRGLEKASPSGFEGGSMIQLEDIFHSIDQNDAMLRGTLIHAWFEQIQWLEDALPEETLLRHLAEQILSTEPNHKIQVDPLLTQFRNMLAMPAINQLFQPSSYQPPVDLGFDPSVVSQLSSSPLQLTVQNERRFAVKLDNQLLSGSIDRLVLMVQDGAIVAADVVDFKTDAIDTENAESIEQKVSFYRPQLQAYRKTVAQMTGLAEGMISARLAFVNSNYIRSI